MLKLMWSNIARRRNQSMLTISITALTIMSFVLVLGVFRTMDKGLTAGKDRLGADCIFIPSDAKADGYEMLFTANPENVYMSADVFDQIAELYGVSEASPQFFSQTLAGSCCDLGMEMRIAGIDPETDFLVNSQMNIRDGDVLGDDDIIVGGQFTDYVGKRIRVLAHPFNVAGELYPTGTGMDNTIYMNMDTARKITVESDQLNTLPEGVDPSTLISCVMVRLKDGVDPKKFQHDLIFDHPEINAQCITASETIASVGAELVATTKVMLGLWLASLLIAVLALIGRFNALAKDRKKEIGLLRAIGVRKGQVFRLIIGEACTMALIGGVIGSAAASALLVPVMKWLEASFKLPPAAWDLGATALSALLGILLALVLGFLASVRPAMKSASLEPQTAITQGEVN